MNAGLYYCTELLGFYVLLYERDVVTLRNMHCLLGFIV